MSARPGSARSKRFLTTRRLAAASVLFGLFVLFDIALFGWLVLSSLSQREIEQVLLDVQRELEPVADALEQQAEELGQEDLYVVVSVSTETQTYLESVLTQREIVRRVEILDHEGKVVWHESSGQELPIDDDVPRVDSLPAGPAEKGGGGLPLVQEVAIGEMGKLVFGLSEEEVQRRIGVLRGHLVRQVVTIAVVTILLLGLAFFVMWQLFRRARAAEEQADDAERMAYVGTLASGLAHEIRNPLNSLQLNMQMLEEEARDRSGGPREASAETRLLSITRSEIGRLERLVTDFLSYARPQPPERELARVSEVLESTRDLLAAEAAARGVRLTAHDETGGARIRADVAQLRQALLNLSQNALAAVERVGRPGTVELRARADDGDVVLEVEDNGAGIAPEARDKVFEIFYSTKKGGTGLGLAIVDRIARNHDAKLDVESEPGRGTLVSLRLPDADLEGARVMAPEATGSFSVPRSWLRTPPR